MNESKTFYVHGRLSMWVSSGVTEIKKFKALKVLGTCFGKNLQQRWATPVKTNSNSTLFPIKTATIAGYSSSSVVL